MPEDILVRVADLRAGQGEVVLATLGLGSCVAIALHDPVAQVGGLAHILLPSPSLGRTAEHLGRYPQTAVPATVRQMVDLGADPRRLTARLVGGASMFINLVPAGSIQMGERNVIASREVLSQLAIPITGERVGGTEGRSVWFRVHEGRVLVRSVGRGVQEL
ncbi:MAG TPA: chemotaxis protein CheD [Gemmatimonadales bacterium]|nr:chemotaxis protein CheD [Gemmatimonadales bacterium]